MTPVHGLINAYTGGSYKVAIPVIAVAALMIVAACAGSPQTRVTNSVAIACSTYAKALDKAADNKARLSPGQVETINKTNKVTDVICLPDSPIDPAAAVSVVQSAIKTVEGVLK